MKIIRFLPMLVLTACATVPVTGELGSGKTRFIGEATSFVGGAGNLTMTADDGTSCAGQFQRSFTGATGTGTFQCDDGRRGTFTFVGQGNQGRGIGRTDRDEPFKFTFGEPDTVIQYW